MGSAILQGESEKIATSACETRQAAPFNVCNPMAIILDRT